MPLSPEKKSAYFEKLSKYIDTYSNILLFECDNVGSKQIAQIRMALRANGEKGVMLMGKNTLIRKIINVYIDSHPGHPIENLVPLCRGNIGFCFTNGDLSECREILESNRRPAPARVGAVSPANVVVPPGPTGCDPGQTSFFQALGIATKIQRGQIEIVSPVNLISVGDKVGSSEAALLTKLDISPFEYGLVCTQVYCNGSTFPVAVLSLDDAAVSQKFMAGVNAVASLSLVLGIPTLASLPHSIHNAFRSLVSVVVELEKYSFEKADPYKAYLADPSAFAGPAVTDNSTAAAAVVEEKKEEEESEEEMGGMDMFGGDAGY